ncbi:MAG: STAS domain-containing protein [Candidatus Sulfopaludibacter sp.]|nr:STAS domain-containing protein [Candidatus Sulfopaludibacter sp.]
METHELRSLIRLQEDSTVASAAELKRRLLEGLAGGGDVQLDLERLADVDVTLLQLLVAAGREAARSGARLVTRVSPAASAAARGAGFDSLPGCESQRRSDG